MENLMLLLSMLFTSCTKEAPVDDTTIIYTMPEESAPHEGTWLQWPHQYQYGKTYRNRLDATWIAMTRELIQGEKVHIIAYDLPEQERIVALLKKEGVALSNIDFSIYPTDDVWVRDNGPIYVKDQAGKLFIENWGFNGWGRKAAYTHCDAVPARIAPDCIDLSAVINEGGSVEIDGNGTLMACKSSILNKNRNPGMTLQQVEGIFSKYLGVKKFIWLEGKAGLDITDMHIDGFARFANPTTIITMDTEDLLYWQVPDRDINTLYASVGYQFVKVPLTQNEVITTYGKNLGKASYINYYIANNSVLVPVYNDPNDGVALQIIQELYPGRKVVGIDCRDLFANGGMVHCVTQQQPR